MSETITVFRQVAEAAAAALADLPEVSGRVYIDPDVTLTADLLPALAITIGGDTSSEIDDETLDVRMQLQLTILASAANAVAGVDPIERAAHLRLRAGEDLAALLVGSLKRVQGDRRVLRETEDRPVMRRVTYEARVFADPRTLAALQT